MKRNFMLGGIACIGAKWRGKGKEAEQGGGRGPRAGVLPRRRQQPSEYVLPRPCPGSPEELRFDIYVNIYAFTAHNQQGPGTAGSLGE